MRVFGSASRVVGFASLALLGAAIGCTGESAQNLRGGSSGPLRVLGCNLGCSGTGCGVSEIAQNQSIELTFSQIIDPATVGPATISIKTARGEQPTGNFVTDGNKITFQPSIRISGGATLFGFRANETYILSLPGGPDESQSLRSNSGDPLSQTLTCSLTVSRGIIDVDNQKPKATLVSPQQLTDVGEDATIVVEISEPIDLAPFIGSNSATSPILYRIRRTRVENGQRVCDPNAAARVLDGVPRAEIDPVRRVTVVTMRPAIRLPGQVCVEIEVTPRVRDLSGKAADTTTFVFRTKEIQQTEKSIAETFDSDAFLDRKRSNGFWKGGVAVPGKIGGDGLFGEFDVTLAVSKGSGLYELSTDNITIPGTRTLDGNDYNVTDGVFRFTNFTLEANQTLQFTGAKIPQIFVRGECRIEGKIQVNAPRHADHNALGAGQAGNPGGLGGAPGGKGGNRGNGTSHTAAFDGSNGSDVALPSGHAYAARAVGTGGVGARQFPLDGLNSSVTFKGAFNIFSDDMSAGGGGGGFWAAGLPGKVTAKISTGPSGPDAPGGKAFDPFPLPGGANFYDHFLIGGSGGGGGASHPFGSSTGSVQWKSGAGGGGGGGAVAFVVGGDMLMAGNGAIEAKAGSAPTYTTQASIPGLGGGGSGGSVILQVEGSPVFGGSIDVSGGSGALAETSAAFLLKANGGSGAPGFIYLEVPSNPSASMLGTTVPPATSRNVGTISVQETAVGQISKWRASRLLFPPQWVRYVIRATENGNKVLYSDDGNYQDASWGPNVGPANSDSRAIRFLIQGAQVNATSNEPDPNTIKGWRDAVGGSGESLDRDEATGYRFQLRYKLDQVQSVEVEDVTIFYIG